MLEFPKNCTLTQEQVYKWIKFNDCIEDIYDGDGVIFGSTVYDYIWRWFDEMLVWNKFDSLTEYLEKNSLYIYNINVFHPSPMDLLEYLKNKWNIISVCRLRMNYSFDIRVQFNNPFGRDYYVDILIADDSDMANMPFRTNLSLIGSMRQGFTIVGQDVASKWVMDEYKKDYKLYDAREVTAVIQKISKNILSREVTFFTRSQTFHRVSVSMFHKLEKKKYSFQWNLKGIQIIGILNRDGKECSICKDKLAYESVILSCQHEYHIACITKWSEACRRQHKKCSCPLCREEYEYFYCML